MLNHMVLTKLMTSSAFLNDPSMMFGGTSVIDPADKNYCMKLSLAFFRVSFEYLLVGISLGGILGTVFMATSQDIVKGTLNVPGTPFGLLCPRSLGFAELYCKCLVAWNQWHMHTLMSRLCSAVLKLKYPRSLDHISLFNVFQMLWDRFVEQ